MLTNSYYRLTVDKQLRVAYFGGSITGGAGSSDNTKTCWRALVTDWFRRTFSEAEIIEIDASIGGTGTGYGMFRCERDVLSQKPDLIFLEFAANDWGDSYENVLPQAETIFRKIRRLAPCADTVTVFSLYESIVEDLERGIEYEARSAHTTAAHRYGNAVVDPGAALYAHALHAGGPFIDFVPDTVHPNDAGHRVMADCVIARISAWFSAVGEASYSPLPMPQPLCDVLYENAQITACGALQNLSMNGFSMVEKETERGVVQYLETVRPGDTFSFTFEGTLLGFYWMNANINGDIFVRVDGGEEIRVRSWDHFVRSFARMRSAIVYRDLSRGLHTVEVRAAEFTPTEVSPDAVVRIGGIFTA